MLSGYFLPPNLCRIIAAVFLFSFSAGLTNAQDRGMELAAAVDFGEDVSIGKQWAVFIAIDNYEEWKPLSNPVKDASELKNILTENYFIDEVRELYDENATAANIRRLFIELRENVKMDDSVFVYYAGHGHLDENTNTGSWIPVDGGQDRLQQTNWLPNIQIRNMLSMLAAQHVFLVADSCFSGDILDANRSASPKIDSEYYRKAYNLTSRQVMTSGSTETVPDTSEFTMRLKNALLRTKEPYVDPEYLFVQVRNVRSTSPKLGFIQDSIHQEGGSFLFFRRPKDDSEQAPIYIPQDEAGKAEPAVLHDNKNIGAGKKLAYGAANIALGLGSYLNGDISGGITLSAGYAVSAALFLTEAFALDWNSPMVGIPATAGISIAAATFVYGFIRPFIFNRSPKAAEIMDNTDIRVVPFANTKEQNKQFALQMSYSIKW